MGHFRFIAALGAVVAGGVGVGLFSDFSVVDRLLFLRAAEQPEPARHQQYMALLDLFRQTYEALAPIFAKLAGLAAEGITSASVRSSGSPSSMTCRCCSPSD